MTAFKTLDDIGNVKGKRVLVRVDLNVPVADGKVTDATRIERVAPTIIELSDKGAKVILLAHFGRPKDGPTPEFSLEPIARATAEVIGRKVGFGADCVGDKAAAAVSAMQDGDILLLENTRFHKGEEKNDKAFTEALAKSGDIFVNDAFSAAHRAHSSTEGLARHLPAHAGRTMQAELDALEAGLGNPKRPVVAIVGGAKVSTKIDLLTNLVEEGRRAGDRRRHGQHVPRGARHQCRQVAVRARFGRDRQADHDRRGDRRLRHHLAVGRRRGEGIQGRSRERGDGYRGDPD